MVAMDLSAKLARLSPAGLIQRREVEPPPQEPRGVRRRAMLDAFVSRQKTKARAAEPLRALEPEQFGTRIETPHGPVQSIERILEPDHHHGGVPVARMLGLAPDLLSI